MIQTSKELNWLCKNKIMVEEDGNAIFVCKDCDEKECVCDEDEEDFDDEAKDLSVHPDLIEE